MTTTEWIKGLVGLSDDPDTRAMQIALAAIDRAISVGDGTIEMEAAYEALQERLSVRTA